MRAPNDVVATLARLPFLLVDDGDEFLIEVRQPDRADLLVMVRSELEVGRECDGLILDDPKISRLHARLSVEKAGLFITDLQSTNGTLHNGTAVTAAVAIRPGDEITMGRATLRIDPTWHARRSRPAPIVSKSISTRGTVTDGTIVPGQTIAGGAAEFAAITPQEVAAAGRRTSIDIVAEAVQTSGFPSASELANDEGTLTIVFSDIESSTEMASSVGDAQWMQVLAEHNRIILSRVAEFGGRDIKSQGDGFMLSFPSARRALIAMIRVQQDITAHAKANPTTGVRVRIGLHTGEVIKGDDGDVFGRHVIMAARIAGQATGGQILVSDIVRRITEGGGDLPFGDETSIALKGLGDSEYALYDLRWWDYPAEASG